MDAPPENEDCITFVRIAGFLEAMQLSAPRIFEADIENGFLLLTDLGTEQYLQRLQREPYMADVLYGDAIAALLKMQRHGEAYQDLLPPYNDAMLRGELALFRDWLCGTHLQLVFSEEDERRWRECCDLLVLNALHQPQVFVHRDYHSRNLMVLRDVNPGILDFQDAVAGPFTYDLVSLLKDCYIRWPEEQVRNWALQYYRQLANEVQSQVNEQQFFAYFEMMGIQRQLKAAGIFCRLHHRDDKPAFLQHVPCTLEYIVNLRSRQEGLDFLVRLIEEQILPMWEQQ